MKWGCENHCNKVLPPKKIWILRQKRREERTKGRRERGETGCNYISYSIILVAVSRRTCSLHSTFLSPPFLRHAFSVSLLFISLHLHTCALFGGSSTCDRWLRTVRSCFFDIGLNHRGFVSRFGQKCLRNDSNVNHHHHLHHPCFFPLGGRGEGIHMVEGRIYKTCVLFHF